MEIALGMKIVDSMHVPLGAVGSPAARAMTAVSWEARPLHMAINHGVRVSF
jgi:hypothetical protein